MVSRPAQICTHARRGPCTPKNKTCMAVIGSRGRVVMWSCTASRRWRRRCDARPGRRALSAGRGGSPGARKRPRAHLDRRRMPTAEAMYGSGACVRAATYGTCTLTGKTRARGSGQRVEGVPGARGESPRFRGFVRSVAILRRSETGPAQTLVAGAPSKACRAEARDHRGPTRQNKSGPWRDQTARVATSPPSRPGGV